MDPIPDSTVVYRTLTKARQIGKDGRPLLPSFHRERKDFDGMSVDYNVPEATPAFCGVQLTGHRAILGLASGDIRALPFGLDVIPDTDTHAVIDTNVPFCDDPDNQELANKIAAALLLAAGDPVWIKQVQA